MPLKDVMLSCINYLSDLRIPLACKWEAICREVPFFFRHLVKKYKKEPQSLQRYTSTDAIVGAFQKVKQAAIQANQAYVIKPCKAPIFFFRTVDGPVKYIKDYDYGWQNYAASGIDRINLPGEHTSIFKTPSNIQRIAQSIQAYIQNYNERVTIVEETADLTQTSFELGTFIRMLCIGSLNKLGEGL